jgi:hypothetical protein
MPSRKSIQKSEQVVLRRSPRLQQKYNIVVANQQNTEESCDVYEKSDMQERIDTYIFTMKTMLRMNEHSFNTKSERYSHVCRLFEYVYKNGEILKVINKMHAITMYKKSKQFISDIEKMIPNIEQFIDDTNASVRAIFPWTLINEFDVDDAIKTLVSDIANSEIIKLYKVLTKLKRYLETELSMA